MKQVLKLRALCHDNEYKQGARFARPLLVPVFVCMYYLTW